MTITHICGPWRSEPRKRAARAEACPGVSVLDQTGRTWVGSINSYSPSHTRYEIMNL